jgi:hypothetical protein
MFKPAILEFRNYDPPQIEKGMFFLIGNEEEGFQITELQHDVEDKEAFVKEAGYPVLPYIVETINNNSVNVLATPEQIGWIDEGWEYDKIFEVDLQVLNFIIGYHLGNILIEINENTGEPTLFDNKITLRYDEDELYFEEFV